MDKEMKNALAVTNTSTNEIVLYQPNETIQLEVRLQDETVWLNQQQIAVLFGTQRQAITKHLKNIFESGELERQATCSILELVQKEGNRMVRRNVEIYNLDVIISVGYRVNTKRGIQFRQWANKIIKDYMLKGYAINQRLLAMEEHMDKRIGRIENTLASHQEKIDFFVRTSLPPHQGIFYDGQIFDAYTFINDQISLFLHIFPLLLPLQHLHRGADSLSRDSQHSQYIWLIPQFPYGKKQLLEKVTFKA